VRCNSSARGLRQRRIQLLGHAHLDLAWLWPISETWDVAQARLNRFSSSARVSRFDILPFYPRSLCLVEEHRPDLFAVIQQQQELGAGKLWVVYGWSRLNLINGESIVRQLLYGQRVLEKFGNVSTVAWLPDSFGFCDSAADSQAGELNISSPKSCDGMTPRSSLWCFLGDRPMALSYLASCLRLGEGIDPSKWHLCV